MSYEVEEILDLEQAKHKPDTGNEGPIDVNIKIVGELIESSINLFNRSNNVTVVSNVTEVVKESTSHRNVFESELIIPLYVIIFVLSVVGNCAVLLTLFKNKRMRTVTNVYLVNLAVSDLLLGVFCMPFTLVGQVLRTFIFGSIMCKLIPYFQAVSVSVAVWTLVAISLERYFAICRPLKSRRWQTQFHAVKMILIVWVVSLSWSSPILVVSSLLAMKKGYKCREHWPSKLGEQVFNIVLNIMMLLIPLLIMCVAYSLIMSKLWRGLRREMEHSNSCQRQMLDRAYSSPTINELMAKNNNSTTESNNLIPLRQFRNRLPKFIRSNVNKNGTAANNKPKDCIVQINTPPGRVSNNGYSHTVGSGNKLIRTGSLNQVNRGYSSEEEPTPIVQETRVNEDTYKFSRKTVRSNNMDKSIVAKKKVITMLFVMVTEFFICWAPLHFINTWYLFDPETVYKYIGSTGVSLVQLLAYISSCCNPITYCFMNRKFRQAFLSLFQTSRCCCVKNPQVEKTCPRNGIIKLPHIQSDASCNDSTIYVRRPSNPGRSELVELEAEERV
ncbi:unnamed protein product [Brassicogethes aeneus]|uniref:Gastrin/cholecystokinin type B receptor n=1 Tax=Brassicogethes aeneus TaxID=1431903 RepID=A0A9P0BDQ3_BRAAE|nr:unnamed protein product [Brassicogethes aeneus]